MTKTVDQLSEMYGTILSKLCGIQPKEVKCPHKGCLNHISHPCKVCGGGRFIHKYPDFRKPDNFTKLIELTLEDNSYFTLLYYVTLINQDNLLGICEDRISFLESLTYMLGDNFSPMHPSRLLDKYIEQLYGFKKIIKNTEWTYDED